MNLPIIPRDLEAAWNEADEAAFSNRAALLLPGHEPRKLGNSSPHLRRVDPKVLGDHPASDVANPQSTIESDQGEPPPMRRVWTPEDVIAEWRREGPLVHEPTGLAALDDVTDGGPVYGSRWYLLGAPDAGKTALLIQIAHAYALRGVVVGLLAADEEPSDLLTRLAQRTRWTRTDCEERNGATLDEMIAELSSLPIRMYGPEWTIEAAAADLTAFAHEHAASQAAATGGPIRERAFLGIDSIQTVRCDSEGVATSMHQSVTERAGSVRRVATRHRLIVISTSEMNRGGYRSIQSGDEAKEAGDLASAKESGAIEYSARVMFALRSVKGEPDKIEVHVAKNKHGPRGGVFFLGLNRSRMTLAEADAPPKADSEARERVKDERGHARLLVVAVAVVQVLATQPGIGAVMLRGAVRARLGSCADADTHAALALLGEGVACVVGKRGAYHYTLNAAKVPREVLARVGPLETHP